MRRATTPALLATALAAFAIGRGSAPPEPAPTIQSAPVSPRHAGTAAVVEVPRSAWDLPADAQRATLYREVLFPAVKILRGGRFIGSGTLIHSDGSETFLLTAAHVIPTLPTPAEMDDPALQRMTMVYYGEGAAVEYGIDLVRRDAYRDVALLQARTGHALPHVARLARAEDLDAVSIFSPVYAVGCPVSYDPLPTRGDVAGTDKRIHGFRHWLVTAPIANGNSGGAVIDAESRLLLGIIVRVTLDDQLREFPVYHLGLVLPMDEIARWLDEEGFGRLHP